LLGAEFAWKGPFSDSCYSRLLLGSVQVAESGKRESCCEERQPLAMRVFPQIFGLLTNIFHKSLTLCTVVSLFIEFFKNVNTCRQQLPVVISLDPQNVSTNFPFGHEGPAENVLTLYSPTFEENSNPSVFRINVYDKQQNEKRLTKWYTIH
jgi:hypothetical protein